jgi:hypothetical protein
MVRPCVASGLAELAVNGLASMYPAFDSPVDICMGTSPSQAPKSRPLEKTSPVPIAATMALLHVSEGSKRAFPRYVFIAKLYAWNDLPIRGLRKPHLPLWSNT